MNEYTTDEAIDELIEWAASEVDHCLVSCPIEWSWSHRLTRSLGNARLRSVSGQPLGCLRFASKLWPRAKPAQRRECIVHEAAHVFADYAYRRNCKHGRLWQGVMARLGYPEADRLHTVPFEFRRRESTLVIECRGCEAKLVMGVLRRRRLIAGHARYRCTKCKTPIDPADITGG